MITSHAGVDGSGYWDADPLDLGRELWPHVRFYRHQKEIIRSVWDNFETVVPAGNELGKDFVAGFIVPVFFLTRHPCRVVTTSADHSQLKSVLWGEIGRFIQTAEYPLDSERGGPLIVNELHLRRYYPYLPITARQVCKVSYVIGRVAKKGEGMLGHHVTPETGVYVEDGIPRTLFVADEASGVEDIIFERADTWAKRKLIIGNPYPCSNYFHKAVEEGDILEKAS